jgi:regulator of protease activity HflC (stomatin/prohibitin superfamily)
MPEEPQAPEQLNPPVHTLERPAVDPAQESLQNAIRSGFGLLSIVMIGLVVAYFANSVFIVEAGKTGLISRFGQLRVNSDTGERSFPPGTYLTLPSPFDRKIEIDSSKKSLVIDTFAFAIPPGEQGKPLSEVDRMGGALIPGTDGALLTGDRSLSHGLFEIQYVITDAVNFVENVGDAPADFNPVLRRVAANAIMREVADRTVDDILAEGQGQLALEIQRRIQRQLDRLETGVQLEQVSPQIVEPRAVRDAFNSVTEAQQQRETQINEAEAQANEILARQAGSETQARRILDLINQFGDARQLADQDLLENADEQIAHIQQEIEVALTAAGGQVAVALQNAQTAKNATREQIKRELEQFTNLLAQYRENPQVTGLRLWMPVIEAVLANPDNEILYVSPDQKVVEIVVKRDEQRQLERERQRMQGQ